MNIIIQSLGFKASDDLESFIKEKINGLRADKIVAANVTLYKGPESEPQSNYCEIRLDMPGNDPFVKRHDGFFETAVSQCVDVLKTLLKEQKEKNIRERQANASLIQDAINEAAATEDEVLEDK